MYSKYLYRPSDYTIFKCNKNGRYEILDQNDDRHSFSWSRAVLISNNFKPCIKKDFNSLKEKQKFHREFTSWKCRSDGHGGSKGGTKKEYLEHLKIVKKYKQEVSYENNY